jgi:hypothetical protein
MHLQGGQDQLQLCGDAFFLQSRFVDEHEDKKHGEQLQFSGKKSLVFHIHHPSMFA